MNRRAWGPRDLIALLDRANQQAQDANLSAVDAESISAELGALLLRTKELALPCTTELLAIAIGLFPRISSEPMLRPLLVEIFSELINLWEPVVDGEPIADGEGESDLQLEKDASLEVTLSKMRLFADDVVDAQAEAITASADEFDYESVGGGVLQEFIAEADEMVSALEQDLLNLVTADEETIHRIFRCIHTLKGSFGMIRLANANRLAHEMEALLERVRDHLIAPTVEMETALFRCVDYLRNVIRLLENGENPLVDMTEEMEALREIRNPKSQIPTKCEIQNPNKIHPPESATPAPSETKKAAPAHATTFLKVDTRKLDLVMEQVGEMLVERIKLDDNRKNLRRILTNLRKTRAASRGREKQQAEPVHAAPGAQAHEELEAFAHRLDRTVETLTRSSTLLQKHVMKMRLIPVQQIFSRFPRLVRDLGLQLSKEIDFAMEGEETEIDKSVAELLGEPLIHLIRNSIDHGVESPEERVDAGKERVGHIVLRAYYEGDKVAIEVEDDGKGIDAEEVVATAIERGLITASEVPSMTEQQKLKLIFSPGFSTAETVTDLSGRGVGMDVVRNTVEKLGGTVEVLTVIGEGALIRLKLPITLAIVKILLFKLAGNVLAFSIYNIRETLAVPSDEIYEANSIPVINLRGDIIPLCYLADVLGVAPGAPRARESVIVVEAVDRTVGIVVDEFMGKSEIIVKSVGGVVRKIPYVSGGAILGDGEVVPVIDAAEIIRDANKYGRGDRTRARGGIPKADAGKTANAVSDAGAPVPHAPLHKNILVVEDSTAMSSFLADLLKHHGYEVTVALTGEEALEKAGQADFNLVSTDIVMPGIDGYEFVKRLRMIKKHSLTPVIALTSKGDKLDRIKGFQAGIDEYLTKPLQEDAYLAIVTSLAQRGK